MGYKKVCFKCRKAFSVYQNDQEEINLICSDCSGKTTLFNHKFRPPGRENVKQWKLVEFLRDNGFVFQHVFRDAENGGQVEVPYPSSLEEAREFVETYRQQAYTDYNIF